VAALAEGAGGPLARRLGVARGAEPHGLALPAGDEAVAPDDHADRLAVRAAVAGLPDRQRAALVLRYFADLSLADTAEAMGCAPGTVKALTHQALAGLRSRLGDAIEEVVGNA